MVIDSDSYGWVKDWFKEASHEEYWTQLIRCLLDNQAPLPAQPTKCPPPPPCRRSLRRHASSPPTADTLDSNTTDGHNDKKYIYTAANPISSEALPNGRGRGSGTASRYRYNFCHPKGCDFVRSHTNTQIYRRTFGNNFHRMVSSVFLLFSGWFCWLVDNTHAQMSKCANSCSRLIYIC